MIDNYHLVALSDEAEYSVTEVVGMKNTMRGREGLATAVIGVGSVYFQTKNLLEMIEQLVTSQTY